MLEFYDQTFQAEACQELVFKGQHFEGCNFENAGLNARQILHCRFISCHFRDSDLSNAIVRGSSFREVGFEQSKLVGVNWTLAQKLMHLEFLQCKLSFANFAGLDLRKMIMQDCIAHEIEFSQANLSEVNFQASDFRGSSFRQNNLSKADFRQAKNYLIDPTNNILKKTQFSLPEAISLLHGLDIILDQ
jgi:fluoroquinolone resistance protein